MAKKGALKIAAGAADQAPAARGESRPKSSGPETEPQVGLWLVAAICFGVALLFMLPAYMPGRGLYGSDYLVGGYFFSDFISDRLAAGELPKWVPYVYGGLPLFSNPGGMFYPLRLLLDFVLPTPWILPTVFWIQFGIAGIGMYLLARELEVRPWIALVVGVAYELTGIIMSMVRAGHDGRVIVSTLAPLAFCLLHRGIRTGSVHAFVGASATIGCALLSFQIQSNYYLLLGAALWSAYALVRHGVVRQPRILATRVALGLAAVALAFTLASVNFLPFFDYVPDSPRGTARGYEYSTSFSMPPAELVGLAIPEQHGIDELYEGRSPFKLHTEYVGALVVVLTLLGVRFSRREPDWWFFAGLAAFALTISFGGYTPLYRLYYDFLPGTQQFRAPSISFFLVSLSLVAMAALTLERIARARDALARLPAGHAERAAVPHLPVWLGAAGGLVVLTVVVALSTQGSTGAPRDVARVAGYGRFVVFTLITCVALALWWSRRLRGRAAMAVLVAVTALDLFIVDRWFFSTVDAPERMFAPDDVVQFLQSQGANDRVWVSPFPPGMDYRNHSNYLMLFDIEQAGGEHGNQLHRYNEYAGESGESLVNWGNFTVMNFLRAANVRWIISMVDLQLDADDELRTVHRGSAFIYETQNVLPRAYLVPEVITTSDSTAALEYLWEPDFDVAQTAIVYSGSDLGLPGGPLSGSAEMVSHDPDRVVVRAQADRPALLVLADNYHRDWHATVNGAEVPIERVNHTLRGVVVPAGDSEVVFEFRPQDLYVGFWIYVAMLALFIAYAVAMGVAALARRRTAPATTVGSSRVDLQACKLEYSIVSPK